MFKRQHRPKAAIANLTDLARHAEAQDASSAQGEASSLAEPAKQAPTLPLSPSSKNESTSSMSDSPSTPARDTERTIPAYELRRTPVRTLGADPADRSTSSAEPEHANLHVGKGLELKGKISSCDRLVIEGNVEAEIESGSLTVSASGVVKGDARVEEAEIEGLFDGTLEVEGCLSIRSTGTVSGIIHYGELKIEQGGKLIGEVDVNTATPSKRGSKTDPKKSEAEPPRAAAE